MKSYYAFVGGFILGFILAVGLGTLYVKHEINSRMEQLKALENVPQKIKSIENNIPDNIPEDWRRE